jgi:hypothetical protein
VGCCQLFYIRIILPTSKGPTTHSWGYQLVWTKNYPDEESLSDKATFRNVVTTLSRYMSVN